MKSRGLHFSGGKRRWFAAAIFVLSCALPILLGAHSAEAAKRIALVVGNSKYRDVTPLANPANDAHLMAKTLQALGFTLIGGGAQVDLDKAGFDRAVVDFGNAAQGADVALFYYAGHGLQVNGANYLVPVDANPHKQADVDFQMLDVDLVLRQMESANARLNLVILDACRNNPFAGRGLRAIGGGLAQMQAPAGTLISFATQPGNVALDGANGHSPFTRALSQVLPQRGLDIFRAFNQVGLMVSEDTHDEQQPWLSSSPIRGDFYFAGPPGPDPAIVERSRFEAAEKLGTRAAWESFLAAYKTGYFADLARSERDQMIAQAQAAATAAAQAKAAIAAAAKAAAAEATAKAEAAAQAKAAAAAQAKAAAAEARAQAAAAANEKQRQDEEARIARLAAAKAAALEQARRESDAKALQAEIQKMASVAAAKAAQEAAAKVAEQAAARAAQEAAAKVAREAAERAKSEKSQKVASLAPPGTSPAPSSSPVINPADLAELLKTHLRAIGCDPGNTVGVWDNASRRALAEFNKYAGTRLDVAVPSLSALEAVQGKNARVCPLECGRGTKKEGDRCVAIGCKPGYSRNEHGACERAHKATVTTHKSTASPTHIAIGSSEHMRLRYECRSNVASACQALCSAGFSRACHHLNVMRK
jgi:uncharacterized caspase-like protein